jgi:choline dehydrogenase-like flavoprotein
MALAAAGSLTLASANPFAYPMIDPGFLTSTFDQLALVYGIKQAKQFVQAKPWDGFVLEPFGPVGAANTDEEILEAARDAVATIWHPSCTARMSPKNASWGVLGPDLRVKKTTGLRVVDTSAFVGALCYSVSFEMLTLLIYPFSQRSLQSIRWQPCTSWQSVQRI